MTGVVSKLRGLLAWCVVCLGATAAHASVPQQPHTYNYRVEHPTYGTIGTFSDTVAQDGDVKRIDSRLRVAVRILGIVVHREEAGRTEAWQGDRLTAVHVATTLNRTPLQSP